MSKSVGALNAILGLNNTDFVNKLNAAKQQSIGFAKDLTALPSFAGKSMSSIAGIVTGTVGAIKGSFASLTAGVGSIAGLVPGGAVFVEAITHPILTARHELEALDQLGKDSRRIGLDPQFMRGLQIAAEDEASGIGAVVAKLLRFQGQLKASGDELLNAGGSSAAKIADKWGLDFEQIRQANPEQLLGIVSKKISDLNDPSLQTAAAMDILGKSAAGFMNTLRNADDIENWVRQVRELGVASKENMHFAAAFDEAGKTLKLRQEAAAQKNIAGAGSISIGWDWLKAGEIRKGIEFMGAGVHNLFSKEQWLPGELADAMREADKSMSLKNERLASAGFSSDAEQKKFGEQLTHWKELNDTIGMSAEDVALYKAERDFASAKELQNLRDEINLYKMKREEAQRLNQEISDSQAIADAEASQMEQWAKAKRDRTQDPLAKLAGMDNDQILGGFEQLEKQFNLGGPARFAGAAQAGSAAAYSALIQRTGNDGADMASRLDRLRIAIDQHKTESAKQTQLLKDLLAAQPGVLD